MLELGSEAGEVAFVGGELFAEEGKVVLFEGGGCQSGFGVEKATKLGDDIFALRYGCC